MDLRILGCDGGKGPDYRTTSLLFNDCVLVDCGSILSKLTVEECAQITDIFLTHSHLDHLADLPFLMDNTFGMRDVPLRIHGLPSTLDDLMTHIFNDKVWPDFSKLPTKENGQFTLHPLTPEVEITVADMVFTPIEVNHLIPTVGFKIVDAHTGHAFIFSGDTGPTERLWEIANDTDHLKAVVVDVSFPESLQTIADLSHHNSTQTLADELQKLERPCDVYVFHLKAKASIESEMKDEMSHLHHAGKPLKLLRDYEQLTF